MNGYVIFDIIGDFFAFLELSDDQTIDPKEAVDMRSWLCSRLSELDKDLRQQLINHFRTYYINEDGTVWNVMQEISNELSLQDDLAVGEPAQLDEPHLRRTSRQLTRIIGDIVLFLELTGEDKLNLDDAVKVMESIAGSLVGLDHAMLRALIDAFAEIAPEYGKTGEATVRDIPRAYGLQEALAADDPVRLAELEALDDARETEDRDDPLADFPGVDWRADVRRPYLAAT